VVPITSIVAVVNGDMIEYPKLRAARHLAVPPRAGYFGTRPTHPEIVQPDVLGTRLVKEVRVLDRAQPTYSCN
jgi:hypothetical protein